jgi:HNH endonuclease
MGRRSDIKPLPSLERLEELFSYDECSGLLTWKMQLTTSRSNICHNNKCGGKVAGTINEDGYVVVGIARKYYLAHRIIWKLKTGSDPVDLIDHEDTDNGNNRWLNLREAANGPNIQNSKIRSDNKSGVKGVFWDAPHKAWRAVLTTNGVSVRLGRFKSLEIATNVITQARLKAHGEFARMA